ncbi:MAG: AsnC family transcriptional regulator [Candidatus Thorarchaeota archaeon]
MDWLDKKIIRKLMENCRESYHSIARAFNVTCPTITNRVTRMRQSGVIQRFVAEISHEAMGVDWIMSELRVNRDISKLDLLKAFEAHSCVGDVFMLGNGRYLVLAEVYPEERQDYVSCLKSIDDIDYIEVSNIEPMSNGSGVGRCKFTTSGEKIELSKAEVDILRFLTRNGRTPIKTMSDHTGYSPKYIRKLVSQFIACKGIHLTLRLDLSQCGRINFILRTRLRDMRVEPEDVTHWVACRYPEEYWFSLYAPRSDSLFHYMTVRQPNDIEAMLHEAIQQPSIDEVEPGIIYSMFKSEGRTQEFLRKCAGNISEEEWEIPVISANEAEITN